MEARLKILLLFMFLIHNSVAAQPVPRLSSEAEWRALLDLRSSLGIRAKDWHKKANPCLNWTGIECKDGHVTGITLSGLRRTREGRLNPRFAIDSLPNFPLLSTFNSSGFELPGQIPEWLGDRLSNLELLDLRSSSIYGSIPSSLGSLSRLSSLYLSNNLIAGNMPTALGKLFSLSVLDLSQNSLTGQIPGEISALGNLSRLDLSSNYLSGEIPLSFGSLSTLKQLNLSNNSLSAFIPAQLGNLSQLIELDLGFNSFLGSLTKELGGLRSLRKMLVGNNRLEGSLLDGLFQELARLEYLVLCENSFVETLPDAIWSMSNLKYLDVSGNNLTGVFPKLVASVNVRVVDVSSNYFEGSAPNDTGIKIILTNNCFSSVSGQRNSEACLNFYSERGLYFGNDSGREPLEPPLVQPSKSRKRLVYVMVGVFGGLGFIVILITGILLLLKVCNTGSTNHQRDNSNVRPVAGGGIEPSHKVFIDLSNVGESFTYEQMLVATCNFSTENLIKQGHSGDLFRGTLEGGYSVVVKRVDLRSTGGESVMSELDLFGRVLHPRLVPLVGHCLEDEHEKFLVYKYMPNGDLSNAMYRLTNAEEDLQSLDWITRLKIAIGAAEALSYLHHECTPPVVHRDIEASSILLDDKYEVRLGSFSEVCAPGAHQSMIARFLRTPSTSGKQPSGKSSLPQENQLIMFTLHVLFTLLDWKNHQLLLVPMTYCFGKVLLELVTGRLGISRLNDADAKQWLESNLPYISIHEKERVIKIVDQSLIIDEDLLEEVWAIAIVAKSCLNPKASRRPSMRHVLKALENPFKVVREENFSSGRLRMGSSRRSWTAALFSSWHHSSSDSSNMSAQTNREIIGGLRQSERVGSRGSGVNDHSSSHKRSSSDVFPEPVEVPDVERQDCAS
ncbi:putative LRR receptor-like serine/threonine-protein kinase [Sesamum angolense]|uniref:LRR receptor-like serine/threonine-protein kinase n=1 Tax=Sesamum angolense TaxID=2727404 RepID=A0AAE1T708_9LAMI|nr:putative LRR receptor-like serine/threonine-protein kinase [Sesamum angolense]